jgi:hypothetical protein
MHYPKECGKVFVQRGKNRAWWSWVAVTLSRKKSAKKEAQGKERAEESGRAFHAVARLWMGGQGAALSFCHSK